MNSRPTNQLKARALQRALAASKQTNAGATPHSASPTFALPPLPSLQLHDWPIIALVCVSHLWLASLFVNPAAATAKSGQSFSAIKRIEVSLLKPASPPPSPVASANAPDAEVAAATVIAADSSQPIDAAENTKEISAPAPIAETLPVDAPPDETSLALNYTARYFHTKELSEKPRLLQDIRREMAIAIPGAQEQNLILLLLINERGEIDKVELEKSDLPPEIAEQVSKAFFDLRFSPGKIGDLPVKSQLKIEVHLEDSQAAPAPLRLGGQINPRAADTGGRPSNAVDNKTPVQK